MMLLRAVCAAPRCAAQSGGGGRRRLLRAAQAAAPSRVCRLGWASRLVIVSVHNRPNAHPVRPACCADDGEEQQREKGCCGASARSSSSNGCPRGRRLSGASQRPPSLV